MLLLKRLRVAAVTANTSEEIKTGVIKGAYSLVYFTPELLLEHEKWRKLFQQEQYTRRVNGFVVDEAHCIKKWGETFRGTLLQIGEIISILPEGVHMMALTATATRTLQRKVSSILGMQSPVIFAISPCKRNIMFAVSSFTSISETFGPILERLRQERTVMPRVLIYCQRYEHCADLYLYFRDELGKEFTEPKGSPDQSKFRLVEMFTSCTDQEVKIQIINSFTNPYTALRIVCATVAFGMGIDCPNIRQVIHLGIPEDTESYLQETGRAGRNQNPSLALLLSMKKRSHHVEKSMLEYASNTKTCRRDLLFSDTDNYKHEDLGFKCLCCDLCAKCCSCNSCENNHKMFSFV